MAADYTQPPTLADYKVLLQSLNVYPADVNSMQERADEQLTNIAAGVWREFQRRTGKQPFLPRATSGGSDDGGDVLYFDGSDYNGIVQLVPAALQIISVTVKGSALTANTGYWAEPQNASFLSQPFTRLELRTPVPVRGVDDKRQIAVRAVWGWKRQLDADQWMHILRYGCAMALGQIENLSNVASINQDGFSKGFDIVGVLTQKDLEQAMQKRFDGVVLQNTRVVC